MKKAWIGAVVGAAVVVAASYQASAQLLLTPGNSGPMPADLSAGPAGFIDFNASPNVQDPGFTAQVDSAITVGNTYGLSALTFWYRVSNVADPATLADPIKSMAIGMAPGGAWQVALNQTGGTLNASSDGALTAGGGIVNFLWVNNPIPKGNNSSWLRVETPFDQYRLAVVQVQGQNLVPVPALVPIPEPATYAGLFALGLAGFAAFRRFRA